MRYFYGRVSSKDQNLARQLELAGDCDFVYTDKESGKDFNRTEYQKMLLQLKKGDTLVIKSLDRFGRDYDLIINEWRRLKGLGIKIEVIDMPILNSNSNELMDRLISDIVLQLLSYVAEQERTNIKERQKEGIAIAKAKGVKFGRPQADVVIDKPSHESVSEYCARVGISRSTYYKYAS
jgi:DNA invertase Pin-like site-specific DNA recombinase